MTDLFHCKKVYQRALFDAFSISHLYTINACVLYSFIGHFEFSQNLKFGYGIVYFLPEFFKLNTIKI